MKTKREKIAELLREGCYSLWDIAEMYDTNTSTVNSIRQAYGIERPKPEHFKPLKPTKDKPNLDRHLCRECIYRGKEKAKEGKKPGCNYYIHTDKERLPICEVNKCTVYVKGDRLKLKGES